MRGFTFSSTSRRAMAVGVTFLATMSAACSDSVTEPKPVVKAPTRASSAVLPQLKYATVNIIDVWGNLLTESAVVRFFTSPTDSGQIVDNSPQDLDPAIGKVKVTLVSSASYKVCVWGWTINYMADGSSPAHPKCQTAVANGGTVNFGNVYMRRKPRIAFYTQTKNGAALPGATVTVTLPNGFPVLAVADGGANPLDYDGAVNGAIQLKSAAGAGLTPWCETVAPTGFALANPSCGTIDAKFEGEYAIVLKHKAL